MTASVRTESLEGSIMWRLPNGDLHRDDGPALIHQDGSEGWFQHGELHRDDGPALTTSAGKLVWYRHGELHRDDGPASIDADGTEYWYRNDDLHRVGAPAIHNPKSRAQEEEQWWQNGMRHRTDGPALIHSDGSERWLQNDLLHRTDGPAYTNADGEVSWWYIHDFLVDAEERYEGALKKKMQETITQELELDCLSNDFMISTSEFCSAFVHIKENVDVSTLQSVDLNAAAIAAWHLPIDDMYLEVAFRDRHVLNIMRHRADVPDYVNEIAKVVA